MLDDLRDKEPASPFFQEDAASSSGYSMEFEEPRSHQRGLSGITPVQRFVLAAMLLAEVCILGVMLLVISGRIVP